MTFKSIVLLFAIAVAVTGCSTGRDADSTSQSRTGADTVTIPVATGAEEVGIRLTSPQEGQVVKSPFLVGGEAAVPGNTVYIRVKKTNGEALISEQARVLASSGGSGPFGVLIHFEFQSTDRGVIEVFGRTESGDEASLQSVPVRFDIAAQSNVEANQ